MTTHDAPMPPRRPSRHHYRPISIIALEVRARRSIWVREPSVLTAKHVADIARRFLGHPDREWFLVLCVDANYRLTAIHPVGAGALQHVRLSPREVFAIAFKHPTAALWLVHNHPTGPLYPTREDVELTDRLCLIGAILEIPILDHVIIGPTSHYLSFAQERLFATFPRQLSEGGGLTAAGGHS